MEKRNLLKQSIFTIFLICFSCDLWAGVIYVTIMQGDEKIYDAEVNINGPNGDLPGTLNLGTRMFGGTRGGVAYDIHVWHLGKHIKETIMMPLSGNLYVTIDVNNYPFTGALRTPLILTECKISRWNCREQLFICGVLPKEQRYVS